MTKSAIILPRTSFQSTSRYSHVTSFICWTAVHWNVMTKRSAMHLNTFVQTWIGLWSDGNIQQFIVALFTWFWETYLAVQLMSRKRTVCFKCNRTSYDLALNSLPWSLAACRSTRDGTRSGFGSRRILKILLSGQIRILVRLSDKFSTESSFGVSKHNFLLQLSAVLCYIAQWLQKCFCWAKHPAIQSESDRICRFFEIEMRNILKQNSIAFGKVWAQECVCSSFGIYWHLLL